MRPSRPIPDWAQGERASDLAWIGENFHSFVVAAREQYKKEERGAIVVDTTEQQLGTGHPFTYWPQGQVNQTDDRDVQRMLKQYDPETEIVIVLLKEKGKQSSYRLKQLGNG